MPGLHGKVIDCWNVFLVSCSHNDIELNALKVASTEMCLARF